MFIHRAICTLVPIRSQIFTLNGGVIWESTLFRVKMIQKSLPSTETRLRVKVTRKTSHFHSEYLVNSYIVDIIQSHFDPAKIKDHCVTMKKLHHFLNFTEINNYLKQSLLLLSLYCLITQQTKLSWITWCSIPTIWEATAITRVGTLQEIQL